jgi:hypothetical protein
MTSNVDHYMLRGRNALKPVLEAGKGGWKILRIVLRMRLLKIMADSGGSKN